MHAVRALAMGEGAWRRGVIVMTLTPRSAAPRPQAAESRQRQPQLLMLPLAAAQCRGNNRYRSCMSEFHRGRITHVQQALTCNDVMMWHGMAWHVWHV